jgi:hypothetical protein
MIYCFSKGLHVISQAKKRDMLMRKELKKYYSKVDECLEKIDEDTRIPVLNSYIEDFFKVHNEQKERLEKPDYHLLVAGNWRLVYSFFSGQSLFSFVP